MLIYFYRIEIDEIVSAFINLDISRLSRHYGFMES